MRDVRAPVGDRMWRCVAPASGRRLSGCSCDVEGAGLKPVLAVPNVELVRSEIAAEIKGQTVLGGFLETAARSLDATAMSWQENGAWCSFTWRDYRDHVQHAAIGLGELGFGPKEFALVMATNRPEQHIADLAIQAVGGVACSIDRTLAAGQIAAIADNSQASLVIVENRELLDRLGTVRGELPALRRVVLLDGEPGPDESDVTTWGAVLQAGRDGAGAQDEFFARALDRLSPDDLVTLIYTSGTTGDAKGVMLTHRNVRWAIAAGFREDAASESEQGSPPAGPAEPRPAEEPQTEQRPAEDLRIISYLPLGTVGARMVDHWGHAIMGNAVIYCCPDVLRLFEYMREVKPSLLLGVPAIFEKLYGEFNAAIDRDPDPKRRDLLRQCLNVGRQLARFQERGEPVPAEFAAMAAKVKPVLRGVLATAGLDRCARAVSGGAPIDPPIVDFFCSLGLPMTQSWGMTELTTAVTSDGPNGSVGRPYVGVEITLTDDDEIVIRGGMVMAGYYRDPEATAAVLDADGWFHTGDIGMIDDNNWLHIVGRKKELIITAGGTNIAPTRIELLLQRHPLIGQACAIGDRRAFVAALLTLDPDRVRDWASDAGLADRPMDEFATCEELLAEIRSAVTDANANLPGSDRVRRFHVLPEAWSMETGELTTNFKKRRKVIDEKFHGEIESMYQEDPARRRTVEI
ncbi:MAG: AMP-binding protein [Actinocatenispora sp.]